MYSKRKAGNCELFVRFNVLTPLFQFVYRYDLLQAPYASNVSRITSKFSSSPVTPIIRLFSSSYLQPRSGTRLP